MKLSNIFILIYLIISCYGCSSNTQNPIVAPPLSLATDKGSVLVSSDMETPKSCKPMGKHDKGVQLVKGAFVTLSYLNLVGSFTDMHVRSLANIAHLFATVETQCNLGRIKGHVASGLPPIVVIKSLVGSRHVRVVIGYDDSISQLITTDPVSYRHIKISYDDFYKSWTDPQKSCLLVHYQYDNGKYLNSPIKRLLHRNRRLNSTNW